MIRIVASSLGRARATVTAGPRAAAAAIEAQDVLSQRRGRGYNSTATCSTRPPTPSIITSIDRRRRLPGSFVANSATSFAWRRLEVAGNNRLLSSSATSGDGTSSFSVLPPRAEEEAVGDANETPLSQLLPPADGESGNASGGHVPSSSLLSTIATEDTVARGGQRSRRATTSSSTTRRGNRRPPHFLSPINRSEGQLMQPSTAILHNEYKHRWNFQGRKDLVHFDFDKCYTFSKMELDGKTLHHATFTCPESGCTFDSGTPMGSQDFPKLLGSANDFVTFTAPSKSGDSSTAQSRNFYASKGFAKNAAAARAIDCLSLREYRLQKGEDAPIEEGTDVFRLCAEEPFVPQASLSTSSMISTPLGTSGGSTEVFFMSPKSRKFTTPVEFIQTSTSHFHNDLYRSILAGTKGSRGSIVERFSEVLKQEVPNSYEDPIDGPTTSTWLTARYTDPVSGVVFRSGTIPGHETMIIGNEVYYNGRKGCLQAAAARAIDCLSLREFRKRNGDGAIPASEDVFRLCEEEPYGDFEDIPLDQRNYSLEFLTLLQDETPLDKNDQAHYFLSPHLMTSNRSPKNYLHNMVQKFHPDLREKVGPGFQSELIETDKNGTEWWTANYNDPLSGQIFEAGTLLKGPTLSSADDSPSDDAAYSTRIIDGSVCYEDSVLAERAAAARAIDCLSLREFQKQRGEDVIPAEGDAMRLCSEEPVTDFDYTSYEERNPIDDDTTKNSDYFMSARGKLASKRHYSSPKEFLVRNYSAYGRKHNSPEFNAFLRNSNVVLSSLTKGDGDGGDYWWTSVFKCPLSGEMFSSGTLRDGVDPSEMRVIDSEVCYESQKLAEQAACARAIDTLSLREFVKRRGEGLDVSEECIMRLCEEEPYLTELDRPVSTEKSESVSNKQPSSRHIVLPPSLSVSKKLSMGEPLSKVSSQSVGLYSTPSIHALEDVFDNVAAEELKDVVDDDDVVDDENDDEEEYVVHTIPSSFAISSSDAASSNIAAGLTTMERVLEAWIERPLATGSTMAAVSPIANSSGSELTPPRSKSSTMVSISNALAWFNRLEHGVGVSDGSSSTDKTSKFEQKHTIGTLLQLPVSVNACNTLLRALADANSRLSFAEQKQLSSDDTGLFVLPSSTTMSTEMADKGGFIESIARQLLERMHGTQIIDGRSARAPSVETYNAYIGCLCRENLAETAVAAETILLKMLDDEQTEVPRPNIETFNLVIERWASVPGNESLTKIKEIYNELLRESDRTDTEHRTLGSVRPNRKTFLSAMFGLNEQYFPEDEARYWLEQMKYLAEKYGDDYLLPDAEAYNAPLRRSGDPNSSHACIHWDDYSSIYKDGFQDDETPGIIGQGGAEAMERWVLQMEELGRDNEQLSPTIESYESVIQAWAKTGTYPGLLRAEQWAQRAIEAASLGNGTDRVQPRLQTFHPILASWAHCGYPERVQQWIDTMHELSMSSEAMTGLTPDGRMQEALIVAWRKRQDLSSSSTLAIDDSPSLQQERLATSIEAANACTECLEQLCAQARGQTSDRSDLHIAFDASTAERVIDAWADVAQCAITSTAEGLVSDEDSESITPALALTEMVGAVESVNEVIDLYRSISMDGLDEKISEKYLYHMNHLMSRSPQLYAKAIRHIYDVDQTKMEIEDTRNSHTLFESLLPSVEKMLRRCHFYNVALIPLGPSHRKERREFRSENELLTYRDSFSYGTPYGGRSDSREEGGDGCENVPSGHPMRDIYSAVLDNCASMAGAVNSGDAFRLAMMVQKQLAIPNRMNDDEEKDSDLYERSISVIDTLIENDFEKVTLQKKLQAPEGRSGSLDDEGGIFVDETNSSTASFASVSADDEENDSSTTKKTKKRVIVKRRFPVSRRTTRGIKRRR